jgi:hypothetical protein
MRPSRASFFAIALALGLSPALAAPVWAAEAVDVLAVTASSTDGMLMDAVDGDPATAWRNKREGEREAWLAVSFAGPAVLRGVRLDTGVLGPDVTIDVESSTDGLTYQPLAKSQHAVSDRPQELIFPKKTTALYLRVRFTYTGSGSAPRFQVRELEAIGGT